MAWGLFNKIKKGFQKVGSAFKKGLKFVNDKIIKPFKPAIKAVAGTVANTFVPGSGAMVSGAIDAGSGIIDSVSNGNYREAAQGVKGWAQNRFG